MEFPPPRGLCRVGSLVVADIKELDGSSNRILVPFLINFWGEQMCLVPVRP